MVNNELMLLGAGMMIGAGMPIVFRQDCSVMQFWLFWLGVAIVVVGVLFN